MILVCDTSNSTCCAGVYDGIKAVNYEISMDTRTHSETFMPLVDRVMKASDVTYDDLSAIAVTVGPGSFTGIRIGLAAVKGMALASGKKIIPVSSTLALAMSCEICDDYGRDTYFIPCFDARNDRVFAQVTDAKTHDTVVEEGAYHASELVKLLKRQIGVTKPRIIVLGSGANAMKTYMEDGGIRAEYAPGCVISPQGIALAAAFYPRFTDPAKVEACYCAVSQAERYRNDRGGN